MIYNHRVKRNGVYYEAGQDVPDIINSNSENEGQHEEMPFSDSEIEMETAPTKRGRPKKAE